MPSFQRRFYHRPGELFADFAYLLKRRAAIRQAMRSDQVSEAFRERLMLAVTQVNGCRYCSYFHAREALKAGISNDELQALLSGELSQQVPEQEITALLYAQHWAESNAQPDPATRQRLIDTYGQERSAAIEIILRMIRMGNLLGNLWDYLLYKSSFGRWGLLEHERNARE
ncbi:MAG: carboxymuconolactone decarboxylase family protein [Anaerolineales bacterium]|nr:carboxymuconolactone decarboxylase family protein [Anaerolineales bacterium]